MNEMCLTGEISDNTLKEVKRHDPNRNNGAIIFNGASRKKKATQSNNPSFSKEQDEAQPGILHTASNDRLQGTAQSVIEVS